MDTLNNAPSKAAKISLWVGALGVVFGDIGTSPLYTMRVCLEHLPQEERLGGVIGVLSLMFWTIMFAVNFKYLGFVTRADNRGEGGIFALLALSQRGKPATRRIGWGTLIILAGAALLYGDGVITPAISVLSAAEGLESFSPAFTEYIVPIAVAVLIILFLLQSHGTHRIGRLFGPIMLVWFIFLGVLGAWHIFDAPIVFKALNPWVGIRFLFEQGNIVIIGILGSIVLTITGAEALYADMGHFGRKYITQSWFFVVFPGLILNYFGQAAYVLSHPEDISNPFFAIAPHGSIKAFLIGLSIVATVIASQSLISGTFSLTRQAIQLGYFPRLKILHTNAEHEGQIYIPIINTFLAIATIWVVLEFKSSTSLAAVYGIAVTGTMVVTTYAFFLVTHNLWKWPLWKSLSLTSLFMLFDMLLFGANLHKIADGGWLPISLGLAVMAVMHTWKTGRSEIQARVYGGAMQDLSPADVVKDVMRVEGDAVFMVATPKGTPLSLLHHMKANKCLQKRIVLLSIVTVDEPHAFEGSRYSIEELGQGVWRMIGRYGYMESPNVSFLMSKFSESVTEMNLKNVTYFFNREMIIVGGKMRMWTWQKKLYAFISRNATPVKDYYNIPPNQIIEIGLPIQI